MRLALVPRHVAVDVAVWNGRTRRGREDRVLRLAEELLHHRGGADVARPGEDPERERLDEERADRIAVGVPVPVLDLLDRRDETVRPLAVRVGQRGGVGLRIALLPVRGRLALADLEHRAVSGLPG